MRFQQLEKPMDRNMKLLVVLALLCSAIISRGQSTIGYEAGNAERNVFFNGSPVPDNNVAEIGFFNPGFDLSANANNLTALNSAWHELAFTSFKAVFSPPNDGRFSGSSSTSDTAFDSKNISLWIFKTTDNAAPLPGFGNVAGYGIFSSSDPRWVFPPQGAIPPNNMTTVTSSQVNQAYHGTFDADTVNGHLFLNPVPEPATIGLLGLAAATLFVARCKRRA